ncbi:MAG: osmotically inducible protein OsmC [SAR86 cluster bacterium]|uniref:Osmotically inducible protein OsmC n=1 Tax=SAR86 cluster bacterium TaxID=2030880 RepID=A0A2A4WZX1_9GAMM|nr:MAG: osmotically inducible protein OsmC [SAR86 cluster bacterium]
MNLSMQEFEVAVAVAANENMKDRQEPLMASYKENVETAKIVDMAKTTSTRIPASTALYSEVTPGYNSPQSYAVGVHSAVGGLSDYATPGDLLCAAIAACLDSTIRIISSRLSIPLKSLSVTVKAEIDVRGTLRVDDTVPVGFQDIQIEVDLQAMMQLPEGTIRTILSAAEHSCVVLQTLKNTPSISLSTALEKTMENAA